MSHPVDKDDLRCGGQCDANPAGPCTSQHSSVVVERPAGWSPWIRSQWLDCLQANGFLTRREDKGGRLSYVILFAAALASGSEPFDHLCALELRDVAG